MLDILRIFNVVSFVLSCDDFMDTSDFHKINSMHTLDIEVVSTGAGTDTIKVINRISGQGVIIYQQFGVPGKLCVDENGTDLIDYDKDEEIDNLKDKIEEQEALIGELYFKLNKSKKKRRKTQRKLICIIAEQEILIDELKVKQNKSKEKTKKQKPR